MPTLHPDDGVCDVASSGEGVESGKPECKGGSYDNDEESREYTSSNSSDVDSYNGDKVEEESEDEVCIYIIFNNNLILFCWLNYVSCAPIYYFMPETFSFWYFFPLYIN